MAGQHSVASRAWELFPHDADIGVRGFGDTCSEAFANAARALTAAIVPLDKVRRAQSVAIACSAPDVELLLVDWLNALIFEMATRQMLFTDFQVDVSGQELAADACGEPIDVKRHAPAVEPKGATLTALHVGRGADGRWIAQCVIDV